MEVSRSSGILDDSDNEQKVTSVEAEFVLSEDKKMKLVR